MKKSVFLAYLKIKFFDVYQKKVFWLFTRKKVFLAVYRENFFCCLLEKKFGALINHYPFLNAHTTEAYVVRPTVALDKVHLQ